MTSVNDPIDRLSVDLEVFGIPQAPGMPPMTETYLHVRRRQDGSGGRAVLGLPIYKGDDGERGPAGNVHKGDRTTAELDGLALVLGETDVNNTYRNVDDNSQWVWNGETFIVHADAYGTPGPVGPAPVIEGGSVTVGGELQDAPAGVDVAGAPGGPYVLNVELPALPEGPEGPEGPSGSVYKSVDVEGEPADGDTLIHDAELGKLRWTPTGAGAVVEEYVVPASSFPESSKSSADVRELLVNLTIPERPFPYRIDVSGGVDVESSASHRVDVEVRVDDAVTGRLVGYGKGLHAAGWFEVPLRSHSDTAILPGSPEGVIPAGRLVTVYASAVKVAGSSRGWSVRPDFANLRIRLLGVA
ncbi:hypothetical protein [Rhodococcus sp. 14-2470-1a]|uniref:hypothetical protein n=1 Tax=Rhodococcus sp. 14-2470-1a TaxID=2023150 RepID=UPI000B9C005B|nr:hypothetical protein [Rhodococcus sp. 14-2470-1a]OZF41929.1 hypothetical protein CH292_27370 [Rhodococcus sp. 14-2470-1a]